MTNEYEVGYGKPPKNISLSRGTAVIKRVARRAGKTSILLLKT